MDCAQKKYQKTNSKLFAIRNLLVILLTDGNKVPLCLFQIKAGNYLKHCHPLSHPLITILMSFIVALVGKEQWNFNQVAI